HDYSDPERDSYYDRDDRYVYRRRSRSSRSRSRSVMRSANPYPDGDSSFADPELGMMVEYGANPLYVDPHQPEDSGRSAAEYDSASEESRRRRRRRSARRSSDDDGYSSDTESETDRDKEGKKK